MAKRDRILEQVLSGASDANISFGGLHNVLHGLGFGERIRGDHRIFHIFTKNGVEEILNLQPKQGKAKPYQVKQVRRVLLKYGLEVDPA